MDQRRKVRRMSSKPVLAYWDIRGLAQHIRLLLKYLNVEYEEKFYDFGPGPQPTIDSWLNDKFQLGLDFPNLPYWVEGDFRLSESRAIGRYIARTRGGALFPERAKDDAVITMVEGVTMDVQKCLIDRAYSKSGTQAETLETEAAPKLLQLNTFMEGKRYILNEKISYMDFYLYEVLVQYSKYKSNFLEPYPELEKHKQNFESLPQLTEHIRAADKLFCFSPLATLQF